jgi:hypothetical protein
VPEPETYAGQAQAVAAGGSIGLALIAVGRGEVVFIHNDSLRGLVYELM